MYRRRVELPTKQPGRLLLIGLAAFVLSIGEPAVAGVLQSAHSGSVRFVCRSGAAITVDFDRKTVIDSTSDAPMPAEITTDTIKWHTEFDARQYDSSYGGQIVHHSADHVLDRRTSRLNNGDTCG